MTRGIWPAFLATALIGSYAFHIWGLTNLGIRGLAFLRAQITEETLKPPEAPTWAPRSTQEGKHPKDIAKGELALGVAQSGDYAPLLITPDDGSVRAAGKNTQTGPEWVAIKVDKAGRVICSPASFAALLRQFKLKPGERIVIEGAPAGPQEGAR